MALKVVVAVAIAMVLDTGIRSSSCRYSFLFCQRLIIRGIATSAMKC